MRSLIASFFLAIYVVFLSSCSVGYYKHKTEDPRRKKQLTKNPTSYDWQWLSRDNHIVLHSYNTYELTRITYDEQSGDLKALAKNFEGRPAEYYREVINDNNHSTRRSKFKRSIGRGLPRDTKQIHLWVDRLTLDDEGYVTFNKVDIYRVDVTKNVPGKGVALVAGIGAGGILLLTILSCGCPHVYIDNGDTILYENTMFTGAIAPQLERYDYKVLSDYRPESEVFKMTIMNEEDEQQFTNDLDLIVVQHSENSYIAPDANGNIYELKALRSPIRARNEFGIDLTHEISSIDQLPYSFDGNDIYGLTSLELEFDNPQDKEKANLLLSVKNSSWGALVFDQFNSLFGKNYTKWAEGNKDKTREDREKWMDEQGVRLQVEQFVNGDWTKIDQLDLTGEAAFNDIVIPLTNLKSSETIKLRLRTGFNFWQVDYAAIDFSENADLKITTIQPTRVLDENGNDLTAQVLEDDSEYMEHLLNNTSIQVRFDHLPVSDQLNRTLILRSKGYYVGTKEYYGKTQRSRIKDFLTPGELSRFSKELHDEYNYFLTESVE